MCAPPLFSTWFFITGVLRPNGLPNLAQNLVAALGGPYLMIDIAFNVRYRVGPGYTGYRLGTGSRVHWLQLGYRAWGTGCRAWACGGTGFGWPLAALWVTGVGVPCRM